MALTDVDVRNAQPGAKPFKLADERGLYLLVQPNGSKFWRRNFKLNGKQRTDAFGAYPAVGLKKARDAARASADLVARGIDPIEQRRGQDAAQDLDAIEKQAALRALRDKERAERAEAKRQRTSEQTTLVRVARAYHEQLEGKFRNAKHASQWISSLEHHVPVAIWTKPITDIKAPELVAALVKAQRQVPETGRRVQQRLAAVFHHALFHKLIDTDPMSGVAREVRKLVGDSPKGHFKALAYSAIPGLMQRLDGIEGAAARALQFTVLTAARTGETIGATWSEFDLDAALWTVPAGRMKAGEAHRVHLAPAVVQLLKALPRTAGSPFVFPGRVNLDKPPQPLSNMSMAEVVKRLKIDATVHGMRSAFSSWANERTDFKPDVIEACLAHRETDRVRAAYNRAQFEEQRRELLQAWAAFATGEAISNVVQIAKAA